MKNLGLASVLGVSGGVFAAGVLAASLMTSNAIQEASTSPPDQNQIAPADTVARSSGGRPAATQNGAVKLSPAINDILRLTKASVGSDVILAYIKNQPRAFNPTADQIIVLKEAGVSADVLAAMVQHRPAPRMAVASARPAVQPQAQPQTQTAPAYVTPPPAAAPTYAPAYENSGSSVYVIPYPTTYNNSYYSDYPRYGWASYTYWPGYYGCGYAPWFSWGHCGHNGHPYYKHGCATPYRYGNYSANHGHYYPRGPYYPGNRGGSGYQTAGYNRGGIRPQQLGSAYGRPAGFQRAAYSGSVGGRSMMPSRSFGYGRSTMARSMGGGFRAGSAMGGGARMGGGRR